MIWRNSVTALASCLLGHLFLVAPAAADPQLSQAEMDARYIVEQTVTQELFDASLDVVGEMMVSVLDSEFRKAGVVASNDALETIGTMLTEEMAISMVDEMRDGLTKVYLEQYSAGALSDYRRFLESPSGQEIARGLPVLTGESAKLGEMIGQQVAPEAAASIKRAGQEGRWPEGTLPSTQREVLELLDR